MNSQGDEHDFLDFLIAVGTTVREGQATTCNDNPSDRTDGESVDASNTSAMTDVDCQESTIDSLDSDGSRALILAAGPILIWTRPPSGIPRQR